MSDDDLFTAPEVACFCKVDLKTIHNWVDRQQIEHFRTPGRHLRFRRADVIDFLRRFSYPVPDELLPRRPAVYALVLDTPLSGAVRRACGPDMEVEVFESMMDLGLRAGQVPPDVIVLDADAVPQGAGGIVQSLRGFTATENCRVILCSDRQPGPGDSGKMGVDGWIAKSSMKELRSTLEALLKT
ncbi:MAG: helix-turn-helix domain-containing protein [Deltaproteobacteria bacterium]|nr:helix-turn-helix domain-containing protein [Deltaproteobacteria bacterium]